MRQKLRLRSDYLLLRLDPVKEQTRGGIIILDPDREPIRTGTVLQHGPGRKYVDKFEPMPDDIVGKRLAFMMAATQTQAGEQLHMHLDLGDDLRLIRLGDVLLEVGQDVEVG